VDRVRRHPGRRHRQDAAVRGRFSIVGTLIGALVLQTLTTTVYSVGIAPEVTLVFKALVIIAACLLQ
jgi:simple sugar transport system permease protein